MGDELILSQSGISAFLRCSYRWYLAHVLRLPGGVSAMPLVIGTATHAGVEAYYKGLPAQDALRASFAAEVALVPPDEVAADPDALPDALKMLTTYIANAAVPSPRLVEAPFVLRLDGVLLSGQIDLGTDDDVRDTKTRAGKTINGKKPAAFDPESHRLQLTLYALGYRVLMGHSPRRLLLDVLSRSGTYKQYEVQPDFAGLREVVGLASRAIIRGEFEPTGALSGACYYCPYRAICAFSTARDT